MSRSAICFRASSAIALLLAAACTSGTSASGSTSSTRPLPPTVCERKIVTTDDVASLLAAPINVKPLTGDPQSCIFDDGTGSITISVRPGLGDVSVNAWTTGKVPVPAAPVSGVGDRAVWQDTMRELIATKHNVLCDISATGARGSAEDVQKTFAGLCAKIWAAQ